MFADYLVYEFSSSAGGTHVNRVSLFQYSVAADIQVTLACYFRVRNKISSNITCTNNRNAILSIFMNKAK